MLTRLQSHYRSVDCKYWTRTERQTWSNKSHKTDVFIGEKKATLETKFIVFQFTFNIFGLYTHYTWTKVCFLVHHCRCYFRFTTHQLLENYWIHWDVALWDSLETSKVNTINLNLNGFIHVCFDHFASMIQSIFIFSLKKKKT